MTSRSGFLAMLMGAVVWTAVGGPTHAPAQVSETPIHTLEEVRVSERPLMIAHNASTAGKTSARLSETPASVGVVTRALIDAQGGTVLGDALKNVAGAGVHTGFGVHDFFVIRGFDSLTSALVLTDGAPEPEATFYHVYNLERVEVLKGPGAFLYGGNPLSGTVNLIRKQPVFDNFLRLSSGVGYFETVRGQVDVGMADRDAGLAFRGNALWRDTDGYRDGIEGSSFAVNPALTWRPSSNSQLSASFEYVRNDDTSDSGLPIRLDNTLPDVPRTRSYQSPFDDSDQVIYRGRVDFQTQIGTSLILRDKAYLTDLDWVSRGTLFIGAFPNAVGGLNLSRLLLKLDDRQTFAGNQLEGVLSIRTASVEHTILVGVELARLQDEFSLDVFDLPTLDVFQPDETATEPLAEIPGRSTLGDSRSLVVAPYAVHRAAFGDRLHTFLGARFDDIDYEDDATGTRRDYSQLSPMAGISYSPVSEFAIYVNAGRAFAPPSTRVVGDREAEESTQYEVGLKKWLSNGRLSATLALYQLDRENIAIPDDNGVTRQIGDQRSRGVEAELAAEPLPAWYTFLSYAFLDAELTRFAEQVIVPTEQGFDVHVIDRSGNRPAFAPEHLLNFWTTKRFGNGLELGAGARYVGSQFVAEDNGFVIDDVLTFDASVSYRRSGWQAAVQFRNLTDRDYETRGFGSTSVIPAHPFTVFGSLELTL